MHGYGVGRGGFVSFIDSDSEDYPSVPSPVPPTGAGTGTRATCPSSLVRRAAEKTARNPKRHGITTTAGGNFIDLR